MADQIKHAFMITSAINTKFGVFSNEQRMMQTLETISSIRARLPGAEIVVVEMGAIPLTEHQRDILEEAVDLVIDFNDDPDVQAIFQSDNWDMVKNTTEVMCFRRALEQCLDHGIFDNVDRIHKISGRYALSENFDRDRYQIYSDKIITTHKYTSQFPLSVTGNVPYQYMSRLWSWPRDLTEQVIEVYKQGLGYMAICLSEGGYCDIEHMLYKYLPAEYIQEFAKVGVTGQIGPNGTAIDD